MSCARGDALGKGMFVKSFKMHRSLHITFFVSAHKESIQSKTHITVCTIYQMYYYQPQLVSWL